MYGQNSLFSIWRMLFAATASIAFAEFSGYVLHRLMHSERFPALSRSHLTHHFRLYGPNKAMRSPRYQDATEDRASLGNIGMEWVLPSLGILSALWLILNSCGIGWPYQVVVFSTVLAWSFLMFSYLHDRMHLKGFWMEQAPLIRIWFIKARRLHDIHHRSMNDQGKMDRNFGIGFFFFDRIFRTLSKRHCPLNWLGFHAAAMRHKREPNEPEDYPNFPSGFRA
jgi:sterol desaturase/sphingolipid hydroxylase (fatty acid hydroxylase superfamily)